MSCRRNSTAKSAILVAVAIAAGACGSAPEAGPDAPQAPTARASGGAATKKAGSDAPPMEATPYTAEEIRDATRAGRTYVFALEVEGAPPKRRTMRFVGADGAGALVESETSNPDGSQAIADPAEHVTWEELRDHAAFPKAIVTRSEGLAKTRIGELDCYVYTVKGQNDETTTFYFAKKMPGAPVLFSTERSGKVLKKSELIEYRAGGAADVAAASTAKIVSLKMAMKLEGDVDEKALVAALQMQLAPLDACARMIPRGGEGPGSLNARITLSGQGPVTVRLESPMPPDAEKCFQQVFAGWKVSGAGTGQSMILLELAR